MTEAVPTFSSAHASERPCEVKFKNDMLVFRVHSLPVTW
jgi:hypothetical protein